jgi:hypothetical protein
LIVNMIVRYIVAESMNLDLTANEFF